MIHDIQNISAKVVGTGMLLVIRDGLPIGGSRVV